MAFAHSLAIRSGAGSGWSRPAGLVTTACMAAGSVLAPDTAVGGNRFAVPVNVLGRVVVERVGPPVSEGHHTGRDHRQVAEQFDDVVAGAQAQVVARTLVQRNRL